MKMAKVLLNNWMQVEEHGEIKRYPAGTILSVNLRIAKEWEQRGDCAIIELPKPAPTFYPWEDKARRRELSQRIKQARKNAEPPPVMTPEPKPQPKRQRKGRKRTVRPAPTRRPRVGDKPEPLTYKGTSELLQAARKYWFDNEPEFDLNDINVPRWAVDTYGGPSAQYNRCEICQRSEWLSRLSQSNQFVGHDCHCSAQCSRQCAKQGDDRFTQCHQDFSSAFGVDPALNAPRGVYILSDRWFDNHFRPGGSHVTLNKRRGLARAGMYDVYRHSEWDTIDWKRYDWAYINNSRQVPLLSRPPIPLLMYGHDHWKGNPQQALDHYHPDILITPFPYLWSTNMNVPENTEVRLYAISASQFFTRPNLSEDKPLDLMCIGAMSKGPTGPYGLRILLHEQIQELGGPWRVGHSHAAQFGFAHPDVPLSDEVTMLNYYSAHLGRSRFIAFAPCQGRPAGGMWIKYYEVLGCGAIPIMPTVPDLEPRLGVKPWEHYIPWEVIAGDNAALADILAHFDDHKHLAHNAVRWHRENADRLLFGGFEDAVRALTKEKYPPRLLEEKAQRDNPRPATVTLTIRPRILTTAHAPPPEVTVLTIPRQWQEPWLTRQENTVGAWMQMRPKPALIFFCDDLGTAEAAGRWEAIHVADGKRNDQGTPLISDVFLRGQALAQTPFVMYCNTDVVTWGIDEALELAREQFESFLLVGARWDVDWTQRIQFSGKWKERLLDYTKGHGRRHAKGALDYFVFPRGLYKRKDWNAAGEDFPPYAVGRSAWDNALVCQANYLNANTVDCSEFVTAIHQNMPSKKRPPQSEQSEKGINWRFYDARHCRHQSGSANNCRWVLKRDGTFEERQGSRWKP